MRKLLRDRRETKGKKLETLEPVLKYICGIKTYIISEGDLSICFTWFNLSNGEEKKMGYFYRKKIHYWPHQYFEMKGN